MYIDWRKPLLFLTFEHAKGSTRTSKALSASWEGISPARPRTAWQDNVTLWKLWNVRYEKNLKIKKKKLCPFAVKNIQMVSVRLFPNWGNFVQGELQELVLISNKSDSLRRVWLWTVVKCIILYNAVLTCYEQKSLEVRLETSTDSTALAVLGSCMFWDLTHMVHMSVGCRCQLVSALSQDGS